MTQNTQHTPGPWTAYLYSADCEAYVRSKSRHWAVAVVHTGRGCTTPSLDISNEERDANARLIADAPAMSICLEMISLGIARIERSKCGFTEFCFDGIRYMTGENWAHTLKGIGWETARAAIAKAKGE